MLKIWDNLTLARFCERDWRRLSSLAEFPWDNRRDPFPLPPSSASCVAWWSGSSSTSHPRDSVSMRIVFARTRGPAICRLTLLSLRSDMSVFLVASTAFLLLIGAGLMSRSVGFFQMYRYVQLVGADIAESGDGPGSYDVHGNVWQ